MQLTKLPQVTERVGLKDCMDLPWYPPEELERFAAVLRVPGFGFRVLALSWGRLNILIDGFLRVPLNPENCEFTF